MKYMKVCQCAAVFFLSFQLTFAIAQNVKEIDTKGSGEIKQFLSASFGSKEAVVKQAIGVDFKIKEGDIRSDVDTYSGMRFLEVSVPSFRPLDMPATVRYMFGYSCACLTQVKVDWKLPEQLAADKRAVLTMSIAELVKHLSEKNWPADQVVTDRAIGEVKLGASLPFVFFRGVNVRNTAVVFSGEPVQILADKNSPGKFSADFDKMRSIQLFYQLDSKNPDVRKINVQGF